MSSRSRWARKVRVAPAVLRLLWRLRRLPPRLGPEDLVRAVTPRRPDWTGCPDLALAAAWLARALVRRLPRLFPQPCLYGSLAGYHFLTRGGSDARVHFGLRPAGEELEFHAWLSVEGRPCFDDAPAQGFQEMLCLPRPASGVLRQAQGDHRGGFAQPPGAGVPQAPAGRAQ